MGTNSTTWTSKYQYFIIYWNCGCVINIFYDIAKISKWKNRHFLPLRSYKSFCFKSSKTGNDKRYPIDSRKYSQFMRYDCISYPNQRSTDQNRIKTAQTLAPDRTGPEKTRNRGLDLGWYPKSTKKIFFQLKPDSDRVWSPNSEYRP